MKKLQEIISLFMANKELLNLEYRKGRKYINLVRAESSPKDEKTFAVSFNAPLDEDDDDCRPED